MLSETEPAVELKSIIDDLTQRLIDYSKTANANQAYINRQQALINSLTAIYNSLERLNHFTLLYLIDQQLGKLLAENPEIDGVIISLYLKPNPRNISLIALTCP